MTYSEKYDQITKAIRDKGKEILPDGSRIVLYGSRARGDFREDSDWDIHILIPGNQPLNFNEIGEYAFPLDLIGWDFGETINTAVYTFGDWKRRKFHPFHENVEKDKILILDKK